MASYSSQEGNLASELAFEEFDLPPPRTDAEAASDAELPLAEQLLCKLADAGHPALIAGGWVRDRVLGKPPGDIDIATSARYEDIEAMFDRCIRIKETLVVVLGPESARVAFEVSPFRGDQARVREGSRKLTPEDYVAAAREDAMHRDFTFNALFYDVRRRKGLDFCHGRQDLANKVVRCVGDPAERFAEDYLRIVRAIRFACTLGFTLARETLDAMQAMAPRLAAVAVERVWAELGKLAAPKAPPEAFAQALEMASDLGLAPFIFTPDLVAALTPSAVTCARRVSPGTPCALRMAALLLHAPGTRDPREALASLAVHYKLSKKEASMVDALRSLVTLLDEDPDQGSEGGAITRFALRWARLYASPYADDCLGVYAAMATGETGGEEFLRRHRDARERMRAAVARAANREFLVKSSTLKGLGIPPGKVMGQLMEEGEWLALAHSLNDEAEVLQRLRECDLWPK